MVMNMLAIMRGSARQLAVQQDTEERYSYVGFTSMTSDSQTVAGKTLTPIAY